MHWCAWRRAHRILQSVAASKLRCVAHTEWRPIWLKHLRQLPSGSPTLKKGLDSLRQAESLKGKAAAKVTLQKIQSFQQEQHPISQWLNSYIYIYIQYSIYIPFCWSVIASVNIFIWMSMSIICLIYIVAAIVLITYDHKTYDNNVVGVVVVVAAANGGGAAQLQPPCWVVLLGVHNSCERKCGASGRRGAVRMWHMIFWWLFPGKISRKSCFFG